MKRFSTLLSCIAIATASYFIADNNVATNTISAEPVTLNLPQDLCRVIHDTIESRDTVVRDKIVYKTKYRTKRVVDTVHHVDTVEVPVLYVRSRGIRKEISPDTIPDPLPKKKTLKVVDLRKESETRQ